MKNKILLAAFLTGLLGLTSCNFSIDIGGNDNENKEPDINNPDATAMVLIEKTENGTIIANKTSGNEGDKVILTIAPNPGYILETLTQNGTELTPKDNKIEIVLSKGENKIIGTFKRIVFDGLEVTPVFTEKSFSIEVKNTGTTKYDKNITLNFGQTNVNETFKIVEVKIGEDIVEPTKLIENKEFIGYQIKLNIDAGSTALISGKYIVTKTATYDIEIASESGVFQKISLNANIPNENNASIKIIDSLNGTVEASALKGNADDVITLTIHPDDGYEVDTLKANGIELKVKNNKANFKLKLGENEITCTFKAIEKTGTINIIEAPHGSLKASPLSGKVGEQITLTIIPDDGYEIDFIKVNNTKLTINGLEAKFNLDENENKVTYQFKEIAKKGQVIVKKSDFGTVKPNKEAGIVGETIILDIIPDVGYEIDTLKANNEDLIVKDNKASFVLKEGVNNVSYSFIKTNKPGTVKILDSINGTVEANTLKGIEGDEIILTVLPKDEKFKLDHLKVNGEIVNVINNVYKFKLLANENIIEATFIERKGQVVLEKSDFGTLSANKLEGIIGETVEVKVKPNNDYNFVSLLINNKVVDVVDNKATFNLIEGENKVSATYKIKTGTITLNTGTHGKVTSNKESASVHELINLCFEPDVYYMVDKCLVNGNSIEVKDNKASFETVEGENKVVTTFKLLPNLGTFNAVFNENGSISCQNVILEAGKTQTIFVKPNDGYDIESLKINGIDLPYTFNSETKLYEAQITMVEGLNSVEATYKATGEVDPSKPSELTFASVKDHEITFKQATNMTEYSYITIVYDPNDNDSKAIEKEVVKFINENDASGYKKVYLLPFNNIPENNLAASNEEAKAYEGKDLTSDIKMVKTVSLYLFDTNQDTSAKYVNLAMIGKEEVSFALSMMNQPNQ